MALIRIYLDEDVHHLIARALRLRGWYALTTVEAGRQGSADIDQIRFAAEHGLTILTYNVSDFPRIHYETLHAGGHDAGVIVATQDDPAARRDFASWLRRLSSMPNQRKANEVFAMSNTQSPDIKADAHRIIDGLPDDATWDDIMYRIYVRQCIESGIKDADSNNVVDVEEVRRRFGLSL